MLEALIFDVDGTLADTERQGHRVANNMAFEKLGLDWFWDERLYGELLEVTGGKERMLHFIETRLPGFAPPNGSPLEDFIARAHAIKTECYVDLIRTGKIPPRSGVLELMQLARSAGLRLAIATTTTAANVEALLSSAFAPDAIDWFEVIAAGDIVEKKKPAADIYDYTLEKLNLDPAQCLAFEDSENGLLASLGAGIPTVISVNDYTHDQNFEGAALVVDSLGGPINILASKISLSNIDRFDLQLLNQIHSQAVASGQ